MCMHTITGTTFDQHYEVGGGGVGGGGGIRAFLYYVEINPSTENECYTL